MAQRVFCITLNSKTEECRTEADTVLSLTLVLKATDEQY